MTTEEPLASRRLIEIKIANYVIFDGRHAPRNIGAVFEIISASIKLEVHLHVGLGKKVNIVRLQEAG
jgi:hypothetical protein